MRLLVTTDTVGGVWHFTSTLTEQLVGRGHAVHLVSFGRAPSPAQQAWADRLATSAAKYFACTATTIPLEWMQNNETSFEDGQKALLQATEAFHPDLILSNQLCFGRLDTAVPRVVVAHSDVLSWARSCRPSALEPTDWLNRYTSLVQGGLLSATAVAVPSGSMGSALTASFFLPANYVVIPNGADVAPAPNAATSPAPERKLQAITAGRLWDEAKGLDTLRDLRPPFTLLVAGDQTFEAPADAEPWPAHLAQLGSLSQPDLHRLFYESAIYLCPSRYEPFGLAPLEAALCGCALVLRDLPSLREIWADSAFYFADNATLSAILQKLSADPDLLAEAQRRALTRALHYTPERMTDAYLHLFEVVLKLSVQSTPHAV